jgi:hypothetical protein
LRLSASIISFGGGCGSKFLRLPKTQILQKEIKYRVYENKSYVWPLFSAVCQPDFAAVSSFDHARTTQTFSPNDFVIYKKNFREEKPKTNMKINKKNQSKRSG